MLVGFFFDPTNPAEAEMAQKCWIFLQQQQSGVNESGLMHILGTQTGKLIVIPAAQNFAPNQRFTRADLASATGHDEASVFSWVRQLGRPETKFNMRVFVRHDDGTYSLTPAMHEAILRLSQLDEESP